MYILSLRSGALYAGVTRDLPTRLDNHLHGRGCRTTKLDLPVKLVYTEEFATLGEAGKRENQIKRWSRAKKEALISGNLARLHALANRRKY